MIEARPDWCLSRSGVGRPHPGASAAKLRRIPSNAIHRSDVAESSAARVERWFNGRCGSAAAGTKCPTAAAATREDQRHRRRVVRVGRVVGAVADGKLVPPGEKVDLYLEAPTSTAAGSTRRC
jgi:hypothetical protein